jgi:hypothetical protein
MHLFWDQMSFLCALLLVNNKSSCDACVPASLSKDWRIWQIEIAPRTYMSSHNALNLYVLWRGYIGISTMTLARPSYSTYSAWTGLYLLSDLCQFLTWHTHQPWRWRQNVLPKHKQPGRHNWTPKYDISILSKPTCWSDRSDYLASIQQPTVFCYASVNFVSTII